MKKIIASIFVSIFFLSLALGFLPMIASAQGLTQTPTWTGIVPCGRSQVSGNEGENESRMCNLCDLIVGIHRIFTYGVYIITSFAFLGVFLAGVLYIVSSGDETLMTQSKAFLRASLIGFTVVVGAWLIVSVTLWVVGYRPINGSPWYSFSCEKNKNQN